MTNRKLRIPVGLLIAIVLVLILGAVAGPLIRRLATPEEMASNVLLSALPFILIFAGIILAFIALIGFVASLLNNNIRESVYRPIEKALIGGIVAGVVGMFQPWLFILYRVGFIVLLISTLGFILWSHVVPKRAQRQE
jgi:hypothetical protein